MGKCELVAKGIVNQKGKPSIEFYKNGKPQYWEDIKTNTSEKESPYVMRIL